LIKKIAICPNCKTKITCLGEQGEKKDIKCKNCGKTGFITFENLEEIDNYPVNEPYAYIKILKDPESLEKHYRVIEPVLNEPEKKILSHIQDKLIKIINVRLDEIESDKAENLLIRHINKILSDYRIQSDKSFREKILYYIKREFIGYGRIEAIMKDPNIEDISCDGSAVPLFLFHRVHGSLKSNILFDNEKELSSFVIKLAQKCGKHISIAEPMLDATMPDGSRIQMTLSEAVTTRGSTFTIRKFRSDPITATDLIEYNTMSAEMVAYMWLAVENGINALIAGGTAAGKTSTLNALCLFIPKESKIVSIEETREINLPHPNWIPGVVRSGFGEIVNNKVMGEIDLFDLMKAALRQRPEFILVGEIRGKEAYVLFQAMATGHTTYSTFHADSTRSLIHRLEGKPIDIPRIMLSSLDIAFIQISTQFQNKRVRRCKQIVEIIDIDPTTKEILTNEVFHWDSVTDKFIYSGKSYILERIRKLFDMTTDQMIEELKRRVKILRWMHENNIRAFKDVAKIVALYSEIPDKLIEKIEKDNNLNDILGDDENLEIKDSSLHNNVKIEEEIILENNQDRKRSFFFKKKNKKIKSRGDLDSTD